MLRHALKLIWNRKRTNGLIIVELALAFLIVSILTAVGSNLFRRWQQPLGFDYDDTWEVLIETGAQWTAKDGARLKSLLSILRDQPEIKWAHLASPPFRSWTMNTSVGYGGRYSIAQVNRMTDGGPEAFGVELLEGRFFDETDASEASIPVLIDASLAAALFPDGFVSGANIRQRGEEAEAKPAWTVVGVFRAFRQKGELSWVRPYIISRFPIEDPEVRSPTIQVRVEPGTPPPFEERLQSLVQAEAPTWSLSVTPLTKLRAGELRNVMLPLTVAFWIAAFLLVMVAFGLFGVLWQSVTRRTDELGLRRALGAHRQGIYRLIVTETLLLAGLASLLGALVTVQFPIVSAFQALDWRSSLAGMVIGLVVLLGLAALCSLYPAWLAAQRSPAEALHYE